MDDIGGGFFSGGVIQNIVMWKEDDSFPFSHVRK